MKKIMKTCAFFLIFIFAAASFAYSEAIDIGNLVDNFQKSTDLQRDKILQDSLGKTISASGVVANAGQYDFLDTTNDTKGTYYQVSTEPQKTKNNTPYQLIFLFKDKSQAEDIDKGQSIQKDGSIIRILDERLQITVWIFCAELNDSDKILLKQND